MKTIGILGPVDAAEVIKLGTDATATAAKALGWKVINLDPGGDLAKTAADMNSLVTSHVDAIVLTIIEPATIQAGLRAAAKAHIPVINTMSQTHSSRNHLRNSSGNAHARLSLATRSSSLLALHSINSHGSIVTGAAPA